MSRQQQQRKRQSAARARAEQHVSGFETTLLRLPEGISFFAGKPGNYTVDVIPFKPTALNPFGSQYDLYYEMTFWAYRYIGVDENTYAALGKTFKKPDPIKDYRDEKAKDSSVDRETLKALEPKERQLFLFRDHAEPDKLQIYEQSYHLFGKLLDSRIKNSDEVMGWDMFYFPDEEGMSLRLTIEEQVKGQYKFSEVTAIDFIPRKEPIPQSVMDQAVCLDELLIEYPYDEMKRIFMHAPAETSAEGQGSKKESVETSTTQAEDDPELEAALAAKKKEAAAKKKKEAAAKKKKAAEAAKKKAAEEAAKKPSAEEEPSADFAPDDSVIWEGKLCTVFKVAGNGASMVVETPEGEFEKVLVSDVSAASGDEKAPVEEEEAPFSDDEEPPVSLEADDDDDDDDDWA